MELREENFTLRKRVKELEQMVDTKSNKVWHCPICMEDDQVRLVLGCGHSVCQECQGSVQLSFTYN